MTIEEQKTFFDTSSPLEFLRVCTYMDDKNLPLEICWYVRIYLKEKNNVPLFPEEKATKEKLAKLIGNLDISIFDKALGDRQKTITLKHLIDDLKSGYSGVIDGAKLAHNPSEGKDYSGIMELANTYRTNLDFSKNDRIGKAPHTNAFTRKEIFEMVDDFKGRSFKLKSITIKLKPKQLVHIVLGHVSRYQVPRKGLMVPFDDIRDWRGLIIVIELVITQLQEDIETHYEQKYQEYNNKHIDLFGKSYGIHIGSNGDIKTFYQLASRNKKH